jgi:hypothetical protein
MRLQGRHIVEVAHTEIIELEAIGLEEAHIFLQVVR